MRSRTPRSRAIPRGSAGSIVTFDGPAAAGKSSVAQRVAGALDMPFLSSGLLYRAATLLVERAGADPRDEEAVLRTLRSQVITLEPGRPDNRVLVAGQDVSDELHTDAVDAIVSVVAAHPRVRDWVAATLREVAPPFAVDGRDMGSTVFPEARHKFFLTASPWERARRRVGARSTDLEAVAAAIAKRDELDAAQLAPAPDAEHVDTEGLALDEVVAVVLRRLAERGLAARADASGERLVDTRRRGGCGPGGGVDT
jgi:CMP/dCMP kinase